MDPMLRIGLKVLLLFLALFFYALHAKNNENHAYLDPKTLRAAGGPRYAFYFLVTRILPAYYLFRLVGSEMCIRDRSHLNSRLYEGRDSLRIKSAEQARGKAACSFHPFSVYFY